MTRRRSNWSASSPTTSRRWHAIAVHAKLAPFAGRNVVSPTVAFLGPVEMWLGILARVGRRDAEALEQLAAARVRATRHGALPTLARIAVEEAVVLIRDGGATARTRAEELLDGAVDSCDQMNLIRVGERARALRAQLRSAPTAAAAPVEGAAGGEATLRRIGDVWTVEYRGRTLHLRDNRGVRLLALLLERPGMEVHSLELVAAVDGAGTGGASIESSGGQETGGRFGLQGGAGPALDAHAKDEYRDAIEKLEERLASAEARRDEAAAKQLREELAFLRRELGRGLGIGGRDRESGSHAERARINVTRAIRTMVKRIATYDAQLGGELDRGVCTGAFCVYRPDPRRPLRWTVQR